MKREKPKRFRKRKRNESKKEERKRKRNSGQTYTTAKGKRVVGKTFRNLNCNCKKKCYDKISEVSRQKTFTSFWNLDSFTAQNAFIFGLIKQVTPERHRPREGDHQRPAKTKTNKYFIIQSDGTSAQVCKKYFLQTYNISDGRMSRALKKPKQGEPPGSDKRGKRIPVNKIPVEQMETVRQHIERFPSYQSHYTRTHNPNRKYLSEDLNIRYMYKLYKDYCDNQGIRPVQEHIYRRTFNTEYNLHFHAPHKDTCMQCDQFKMKLNTTPSDQEKTVLQQDHELHLRKAEAARKSLDADSKKSSEDSSYYTLTFDLEKSLPFPKLTCQIAYYKRNMYVYNLGCHEPNTGLAFMYVWDETVGSRGSQEISACITKHIQSRCSNAKHVVMYSDTCTGQNRNWKVALSLMKLVQSDDNGIETIDQKFMRSGHSYLPNDSDFGSIEMYGRTQQIFCPSDWYRIIKEARKKKPFHLTEMTAEDFLSTSNLQKAITKRKKNENKQPVNWLQIQWLRYTKTEQFTIFYKETIQDDYPFYRLNIKPGNKRGRPLPLAKIPMTNLYSGPRPVTTAKKRDMQDLLPFIPPIHHNYFENLVTSETEVDIGPLDGDPTENEEVSDGE